MFAETGQSRRRAARAAPRAEDAAESTGFGPGQAGFILVLHLLEVVTLARSRFGVSVSLVNRDDSVYSTWGGKVGMSDCT